MLPLLAVVGGRDVRKTNAERDIWLLWGRGIEMNVSCVCKSCRLYKSEKAGHGVGYIPRFFVYMYTFALSHALHAIPAQRSVALSRLHKPLFSGIVGKMAVAVPLDVQGDIARPRLRYNRSAFQSVEHFSYERMVEFTYYNYWKEWNVIAHNLCCLCMWGLRKCINLGRRLWASEICNIEENSNASKQAVKVGNR